jgi:hypothetical protein
MGRVFAASWGVLQWGESQSFRRDGLVPREITKSSGMSTWGSFGGYFFLSFFFFFLLWIEGEGRQNIA